MLLSDNAPVSLMPEFLLCMVGKVDKPEFIVFPETVTDILSATTGFLVPPVNLPQENLPEIPLVEIPVSEVSVFTPATNSAVFEVVLYELIKYILSKNDVPTPTGAPVAVTTEVTPAPTAVSNM